MLIAKPYPSYIKYMGSKSKIIDFIIEGINEVHSDEQPILDLFSGSASLAGAIGRQTTLQSNDIQSYSGILADAYTLAWRDTCTPSTDEIIKEAEKEISQYESDVAEYLIDYSLCNSLDAFNRAEEKQRELINFHFSHKDHLFLKNYSGTWWSAKQCMWIDAIRKVAENHKSDSAYPVIMSSLMFAMAYCSQGTGHYAQYRDAKTASSMKDILIYRSRDLASYFSRKYKEVLTSLEATPPQTASSSTSLDFKDSLQGFKRGVVYADPPYCFVHYSRFYHALETLVRYDFPDLQIKSEKIVKGRYRVDRHQSPFSIHSKVAGAFKDLFTGVQEGESNLVLSYSNTGMISLEELSDIANDIFKGRNIELLSTDHQHMTLGRQGIRHRDVKECLLLVK